MPGDIFGCLNYVCVCVFGGRGGMLLNIPQGPGQTPQQNDPAQHVNNAKGEKPYFKVQKCLVTNF